MRKLADALYQLVLTAWVGGMWAVGYLVPPILFSSLGSRQLAGIVAGKYFALMGWIGLGCAAALATLLVVRHGRGAFRLAVFWLVLATAALGAVGLFGIQPVMEQMKADALPLDVAESALKERFMAWHGISQIVYMIQSLLGAWLVAWAGRGLAPRRLAV